MKVVRQKFFIARELYFSVAIIALTSCLASIFMVLVATWMHSFFGGEYNMIYFILILLGYCFFIMMISMIFSHRFIGPFSRLKIELRMILAGKFDQRLRVRGGDDLFIKSFIEEINRLLDRNERLSRLVQELPETINGEISSLASVIPSAEQHGKLVAAADRIVSKINAQRDF